MNIHFGIRVKQIAERKNLSVKVLAEAIGVREQQIYRLFKQQHINTETLEKLAKALDEPFVALFIPDLPYDNANNKEDKVNKEDKEDASKRYKNILQLYEDGYPVRYAVFRRLNIQRDKLSQEEIEQFLLQNMGELEKEIDELEEHIEKLNKYNEKIFNDRERLLKDNERLLKKYEDALIEIYQLKEKLINKT